ncbi:MAG: twin-arginine translocase subunit TatC, partial [candidate division Zixibacteria bacterium]|nr:twin-arginine translocase subunit TatC [candidate division Zixibacteria bacterium]
TFCYLVVLPISLAFLIGFAADILSPIITVGSYITFAGMLLMAFGFAFQLPVLCYFLGKMGLISSKFLARGRRYAVVIMLVVSAIITPPDVFTQVLLAVPLYVLYEISIIVVRLVEREKDAVEPDESQELSG